MTYRMFILFLSSFVCAQSDSIAVNLANAERAFSNTSEAQGIKNSFLAFLSDDCVMFNPHPVNGKELYRNRPSSSAHLSWYPTFVEVAASGDFGISTGPWEYRRTKNDTPVAYGYFFSVWKKQQDGTWKVVFDNGISYAKAEKRSEAEHIRLLPNVNGKKSASERALDEFTEAEHRFITTVQEKGSMASYSLFAANSMRVYRNGNFPSRHKVEGLGLLKKHEPQKQFSPIAMDIASSGDVGFTYGITIDAKNDSSSYLRVWRKEKEWQIAVDMLEPFKNK